MTFLREKPFGTLQQYALAVVLVAAGSLLRAGFTPLIGSRLPFGTYFLVLSVGALLLDRGPLVALWLGGAVAAAVLFVVPFHGPVHAVIAFELSYYLIIGAAIVACGQLARAASARAALAHTELAANAERYKRLFDLSGIGFAIAEDPACERVTANAWLAERLGIPPGANASRGPTRPQPYRVLHDGRELDVGELPLAVAASTGREVANVELELVDAHGRSTDLLGYAAPMRDEQGATPARSRRTST